MPSAVPEFVQLIVCVDKDSLKSTESEPETGLARIVAVTADLLPVTQEPSVPST